MAGRCASNEWRCARGKGSSSAAPSSVGAATPSSSQTWRTSSGCQTRSGGRATGGTRSPGSSPSSADQVLAALGGRVDHGVVDGVERALGEGRERAHLLDLVAEELDAERLAAGAREDVDEPAAHRDLPALLRAVRACVAGERELLHEGVEVDLVSHRDADRVGTVRGRREPLRESPGRRAHEAALGEHRKRAGALAHEVRGRVEAGADRDAAARQQRHAGWVDVPADRLGGVARVLVLGKDAEQRPLARLAQRGEKERERGLGDARVGGERVRERAEAVALGERRDETVER